MAEENQVEQTTETTEEEVQPVQETSSEVMFTEDEMNEIVKKRLGKERGIWYKKLGVEDFDTIKQAVKSQKDAEEKQRIQKGEFEEILKTRTQEFNKEKENLESQLRDIKINKSLLSSASRNKAINPDQVVELLKGNIQLNESGNVEILDKNGIARYSKSGELLTTDELVQEFLTQNPHFVSATPSGSGTVSNVDRQELNKPLNLSDLDMNNAKDRETYRKYRKEKMSQPFVINSKI
jgi:hypothetical protein